MSEQEGFSSRRLVFVVAAAASLLVLASLLTVIFGQTRESALAQSQAGLDGTAYVLNRQIAQTFAKIDVVLRLVVRDYPRFSALPGAAANAELKALLDTIPESQSLRIVDATGRFRFDASGSLPQVDISDRAYFRQHQSDPKSGLVFSEPIFARITSNWVITLSRRLNNPDGSFAGHVQAAINAEDFSRLFAGINRPAAEEIIMLDRQRRVVAHTALEPAALGQAYEDLPALETDDGKLFSREAVGDYPFDIIVISSRDEALKTWREKILAYGISIFFLMLLLVVLLYFWSRNYNQACTIASALSQAFDDAEHQARELLDSVPDPAWLRDRNGVFVAVNAAYLRFCGKSRAEVIGKKVYDVWPARMAAIFSARDEQILASGEAIQAEGSHPTAGGTMRHYEYELTPLHDKSGGISGVAGFARDVTERQEAADRILFLLGHDTLTTLPNRLALQSTMAHAVAEGRSRNTLIALLLLDLDHFKGLNDTLGPGVGDRILFEVAGRLKESVQEKDTVSRQSGDEFAILINDCGNVSMVALIAERLLASIRRPLLLDGHDIALSACIGISIYPEDGDDVEALLKNADTALHAAKAVGRDSYRFFEAEMNSVIGERLRLEHDLRQALARRELFLDYQPQYDAGDGRMLGVEALLRWRHPQQGLISPASFIPIAEETGLIVSIGEWVLDEACRQNAAWLAAGCGPLVVAVNLSALQITQAGLSATVSAALRRHALPPALLELEITESVLMRDTDRALEVLSDLRRIGIKVSIDDFGTGYSSLNYLKRLPLDKLKIDRSFIRDLPRDANDVAITQAIIAISSKLGLAVIAEGVETREQFEFLRNNGCNQIQGFYFSRPRPPQEIIDEFRGGTPGNPELAAPEVCFQ
ncbi:EAL domain-containing protein [Dechloromonas agitata]|uniref:bifunctional diguanylate cyclase/phosphodiesterase n=1 Tax=Dechloromonas agitata TaxID=73030 RepID=UPI00237EA327|nr:EAL domain-containing protein [Dechloromonas agitata]MDE1546442.1 EAL domain-containing protein [Dechloromonas agitata]